jgi:MFS family permease
VGLAAFAAGSAWAAFSGSAAMLIAARAAMGVGGSFMMPSTLAVITSIFTDAALPGRAVRPEHAIAGGLEENDDADCCV